MVHPIWHQLSFHRSDGYWVAPQSGFGIPDFVATDPDFGHLLNLQAPRLSLILNGQRLAWGTRIIGNGIVAALKGVQ
jgi:hypothetical protein